jgi:hypothetical protein
MPTPSKWSHHSAVVHQRITVLSLISAAKESKWVLGVVTWQNNIRVIQSQCFIHLAKREQSAVQFPKRTWTTIFRHVLLDDIICCPRMHQWIDNFECLIMAFLGFGMEFLSFFQWHSLLVPLLIRGWIVISSAQAREVRLITFGSEDPRRIIFLLF